METLNRLTDILKNNVVLVVACLLTLIVYSRFTGFGYISWDDPEMVFKNEDTQNFNLKGFFKNHYVGNFIPVTMMVHATTWALFRDSAGAHHLVNILLHLLNGLLLYRAGRLLFADKNVSAIGCLIFLLHPLQVESVGWISELKNVLSATFFLLAFITYFQFKHTRRQVYYLASFLIFVIGAFSKSSVIILPLCLLSADLLTGQKITGKDLLNKIPYLIVAVIVGLINLKSQTEAQFINHAHEFPVYQRIGYAGFALVKYVLLFLVPVKLSVIYPYPESRSFIFIIGYTMWIALGVFTYLSVRKKDYTWIALAAFIVSCLILVLQFVPFGEVLYADRYMYLPMMAFGWMMALCLNSLKLPSKPSGIFLAFLFSLLTFSRVNAWKSSIVLYEDIIRKYPNQFIALNSAGVESMFLNEDQKALDYFNRAVEAAPKNYKGYYNRGLLYLKNNRPEQALQSFNQTLALYEYDKALAGRASAHYLMKNIPQAIDDAKAAINLSPGNSRGYFVLGNCYNDLNQLKQAIDAYNKAIALAPKEPDYFFKRAIAFGKQQKFKDCLDDLELCLAIKPDYYEAYYWRGVAKVNLNQDPCPDLNIAARHNFEPALIAFNKYCR